MRIFKDLIQYKGCFSIERQDDRYPGRSINLVPVRLGAIRTSRVNFVRPDEVSLPLSSTWRILNKLFVLFLSGVHRH